MKKKTNRPLFIQACREKKGQGDTMFTQVRNEKDQAKKKSRACGEKKGSIKEDQEETRKKKTNNVKKIEGCWKRSRDTGEFQGMLEKIKWMLTPVRC